MQRQMHAMKIFTGTVGRFDGIESKRFCRQIASTVRAFGLKGHGVKILPARARPMSRRVASGSSTARDVASRETIHYLRASRTALAVTRMA